MFGSFGFSGLLFHEISSGHIDALKILQFLSSFQGFVLFNLFLPFPSSLSLLLLELSFLLFSCLRGNFPFLFKLLLSSCSLRDLWLLLLFRFTLTLVILLRTGLFFVHLRHYCSLLLFLFCGLLLSFLLLYVLFDGSLTEILVIHGQLNVEERPIRVRVQRILNHIFIGRNFGRFGWCLDSFYFFNLR